MAVLVLSVILTPETSIAALAFLATLVCFEFYYRDSARSRAENFRRTILCAASGAILVVVWFAFLAIFAALGSFVFYYLTFAPGHQYTGGFPISLARQVSGVSDARFTFAVVAPVVLAALTFCFFAVRIRFRWPLRVEDWAMGGAALFMALYYTKFLARADHVFESFAVTSPVLFYVVYRAIELLAGRLPWHLRRTGTYGLTAVAIVVTLICAPTPLRQAVRAIPSHFVANAAAEPTMARMGYAVPGAVDPNMVSDLDKITSAYLGPKDTFFDFTNSPGLFSYLLRLPPSTRYYHVSMAIRQRTQSDLISELERRQPKLVIFSSTAAGLPTWDGISNPVRHYDVSQYLLDHYRPLLVSHGYTLMARNGARLRPPASIAGLVEQPATGQLSFNSLPCDWGYAPDFLTTGPARRCGAGFRAPRARPDRRAHAGRLGGRPRRREAGHRGRGGDRAARRRNDPGRRGPAGRRRVVRPARNPLFGVQRHRLGAHWRRPRRALLRPHQRRPGDRSSACPRARSGSPLRARRPAP